MDGNIGGFEADHEKAKKETGDRTTQIWHAYADLKADVGGMQEPNLDWRSQPPAGTFLKRTKSSPLKPIKAAIAQNTTAEPLLTKTGTLRKVLHGGSITMAMNKLIVSRTRDATVDPEKLGRWSSILVEGAQGYNTRFVSAYVPCANDTGPRTVYTQHKDYYRRQGSDREPIQAMIEDFGNAGGLLVPRRGKHCHRSRCQQRRQDRTFCPDAAITWI